MPERRAHPRSRCHLTATVAEFDPQRGVQSSWTARIVDLGRGGLCLRSRRPVPEGRSLIVEVRTAARGGRRQRRVLFGVVRYARVAQSLEHALGVSFRSMPRTAEISRWIAGRMSAA